MGTNTIAGTRVAFITGANRGVGLETARELGRQGITVVLGSRDPAQGERAAQQLRTEGITAHAIAYDAANPDTDRAARAYFEEHYGKLDILINNAGLLKEPLVGVKAAASLAAETLHETFDVNFFAVVRLTQTLLPLIRKSDAGRIVNVSSILASLTLHSLPDSPIAPAKPFGYNASKAALNAFTVHLADELAGTSIKVNSAHPGWVKTELGGPHATDEIRGSGKTSARLATLGVDGPTGAFFHEENVLPW